jgi:hypothetical protein
MAWYRMVWNGTPSSNGYTTYKCIHSSKVYYTVLFLWLLWWTAEKGNLFGKSLDTMLQVSGILLQYLTHKRPLIALKAILLMQNNYIALQYRCWSVSRWDFKYRVVECGFMWCECFFLRYLYIYISF